MNHIKSMLNTLSDYWGHGSNKIPCLFNSLRIPSPAKNSTQAPPLVWTPTEG